MVKSLALGHRTRAGQGSGRRYVGRDFGDVVHSICPKLVRRTSNGWLLCESELKSFSNKSQDRFRNVGVDGVLKPFVTERVLIALAQLL